MTAGGSAFDRPKCELLDARKLPSAPPPISYTVSGSIAAGTLMSATIPGTANAARARGAPRIALLIPISSREEFQPLRRDGMQWLRNRCRRRLDWLAWRAGASSPFHYSTYSDYEQTNRGDIAIRIATIELLHQTFGAEAAVTEIGWSEFDSLDPAWIDQNTDLFVIGGGGYYFLHAGGHLTPRVARDLDLLRPLRCPVISLASGVNRQMDGTHEDGHDLDPAAREVLTALVGRLALSSTRDRNGQRILDLVAPGRTQVLADPALFLAGTGAPPVVSRNDGVLRVGLNLAFHGTYPGNVMTDRLRLIATAARQLARRRPCQFFYFVHDVAERLIPHLLRRLGVPVRVVDTGPAEMLDHYAQLDLHVCQMLHSGILSLNLGVPTINLGYDVKNAAFFDLMQMPEYCLPAHATGAAQLGSLIDTMLPRLPDLRQQILARKAVLLRDMNDFLRRTRQLLAAQHRS